MPDKDTKKNQQENATPAVSATEDIQQQRKEALDKAIGQVTFNPDSTNIGSMEKAAIARQNLTDDQKRSLGVENAIHNTYSSPIREMSDKISDWEKAKNTAQKQDEVAQRRSAAFQMAAGISDSLAALGNLIGVSYGGSHIDMGTGSLTPLAQKIEAARQERKADIKSIDDRLDQYRNQLLQMQLAKGAALAQAQEKEAERAYQTSERVAAQEWKSGESAKERESAEGIAANKVANDAYQRALDRANQKDVARIRSGQSGSKKEPKKIIFTNEAGGQEVYTLSAETYEGILRNFNEAMEKDVTMIEQDVLNRKGEKIGTEFVPDQSTPLGKAYAHYLELSADSDASDQEVENAFNQVISLSPTLKANIQRHGQQQSKWDAFKQ